MRWKESFHHSKRKVQKPRDRGLGELTSTAEREYVASFVAATSSVSQQTPTPEPAAAESHMIEPQYPFIFLA